jgi:ribosome maturation protein Sdo1
MHDSKLGHALKDMQQFLEYYQSSDETIQSILGKLDMIIDIQLKRMNIEIFGENSIDCDLIRKHIKGGVDSPTRPPFG